MSRLAASPARSSFALLVAAALGACSDSPSTGTEEDTSRPQRDIGLDGSGDDAGPADANDAASDGSGAPDAVGDAASDVAADADADADTADAVDSSTDTPDVASECTVDDDCVDDLFCNGTERCSLGRCYDNPVGPCDDVNVCTTDACDEAADTCVFEDASDACAPGQLCDAKAGCYDPVECATDLDCDDGLVCNGTERCLDDTCAPGAPVDCNDDVACTVDACVEGDGECQNVPQHALCLPTELCEAESGCVERPPCDASVECIDAYFCNGTESCAADGLCASGEVPAVDDAVPCTSDACSEALGAVQHTPINTRCSDGEFCNGAEICRPDLGCVAGTPPAVADGVSCTVDSCNEEADFVEHTPENARCEDGRFCNGVETCDPIAGCRSGEPPTLNDGVGCTNDSCSEVLDSVVNTPDDSACSDNLFCNGTETCDPVDDCLAGPAPVVDDTIGCTSDRCDEAADRVVNAPNNAICSDGLACNGAEVCVPDVGCQPGPDSAIDDFVACTIDLCDDETGGISHTPDHGACDDGVFCDGIERCDAVRGCVEGAPPALDDAFACTTGRCDEALDTVVQTPDSALCDNNRYCDGVEICDPARGCVDGVDPVLTDGVGCTLDSCDEVRDAVEHAPTDALCADSNVCDGDEVCDPVDDCVAGAPPDLDDGVDCTIDICGLSGIEHLVDHGYCDNNVFCDGAEVCDRDLDCIGGAPVVLSDGVPCTADSCNEALDRVDHTPNNAICDNGSYCDGNELCDIAAGCIDGADPVLSDGVSCTDDVCNEGLDRVDHLPDNDLCDNKAYCDGLEYCDAVEGCLPGPSVVADAFSCTVDTCNEADDTVAHTPDNAACVDTNPCNGTESCSAVSGCVGGTPLPDNTLCSTSPRSICRSALCVPSTCGDGFRDIERGEQCDDGNRDNGDGCNSDCAVESSSCPNVTGIFTVTPRPIYSCVDSIFGDTVIDFNITQFIFSTTGSIFEIDGAPVTMVQNPKSSTCDFVATGSIPGGCTETYSLTGTFTGANTWTGTFRMRLAGQDCAFTECTNQTWSVTGTRL